jgi:hypothetical protein
MVGLEEGEWGVENVLERLRIGRGGMEVVVDVGMRDEKRREELEAVESVFDERYVPNPEKPEEHVTIAIPPLDPESATTDDLMIHILFPSDPISSPYPSATHPTSDFIFKPSSTANSLIPTERIFARRSRAVREASSSRWSTF